MIFKVVISHCILGKLITLVVTAAAKISAGSVGSP